MDAAKKTLKTWAKTARAYNRQTTTFFRSIVKNVGTMTESQKAELTTIIEEFIVNNDDVVNRSLASLDEIATRIDVSSLVKFSLLF